MPIEMTTLIARYHTHKHHPLARGMMQSELGPLLASLQSRLTEAGVQANLAQQELPDLRRAVTAYAQCAAQRGQPFSEEDHLRIIREITAFHGNQLMQEPGCIWIPAKFLLEVAVADPHLEFFTDQTGRPKVRRFAYHVGWMAANIWETALSGDSDSQITVLTHTWRYATAP